LNQPSQSWYREKKEYIKMKLEREVIRISLAKAGSERKKNILK
jgi:hypothetical protein